MEWAALSGFEKTFWLVALPSTILFVIQAVMAFVGASLDHDVGFHHDVPGDHPPFPLLSLRGLIAFFLMFGWTGIVMIRYTHAGKLTIVLVSVAAGFAMMVIVATIFYLISKLAVSGNVELDRRVVGCQAKVYLKIPAAMAGFGKVSLVLQGRMLELPAGTQGPELPTGTPVMVRDLADGTVVVEKLNS